MTKVNPKSLVGQQIWVPDHPANEGLKGRLAYVESVDGEGMLDVTLGIEKTKMSMQQLLGSTTDLHLATQFNEESDTPQELAA